MSGDYQPGEIVNIEIKGARVLRVGQDDLGSFFVEFAHGRNNTEATVDRDDPSVTITRTPPANWPPQVNDQWQSPLGFRLWAVLDQDTETDQLYLMAPTGDSYLPDRALEKLGPLTLAYRDQQDGGERG